MTREEAKKAAEVMMAYADGKEIECKYKCGNSHWKTAPKCDCGFYWKDLDYRIKPEPPYRPFKNGEECWAEMQKHQPFGWIVDKKIKMYHSVIELNCICLHLSNSEICNYEQLFKWVAFADGTPFGIKKE